MRITRAADYAVRVVVHLASLPPATRVSRTALMRANEVPESFLSKVLQRLVAAGVLLSRRGGGGGFELAVPAEQLTALRIVEAIDGPIRLNRCIPGDQGCDRSGHCAVHPLWLDAQAALVKILGDTTMAELGSRQRSIAQNFQFPEPR